MNRHRTFAANDTGAPSAEQEAKVREVARVWADLEPMMREPRIARALKPHHDFWIEFWGNWKKGKKDESQVNHAVTGANAARSDALGMKARRFISDPAVQPAPANTVTAARRAAEWIDENAPTFRGISAAVRNAPGLETVAQWLFTDSDPTTATKLAVDPNWPAAENERLRAVRALAAQTGWIVDALRTGGIRRLPDGTQVFGSDPNPRFPDAAHQYAAATIARTWMLLVPGQYRLNDVLTNNGSPAQVSSRPSEKISIGETGNPVVLAIGAFVARAAFAAAIVYVAQMSGTTLDRQLKRGSDTERMMGLHKAAVAVIGDHAQREIKEGRPIPFTDQEKRVLDTLLEAQRVLVGKDEQSLPNPFGGAIESLGKAAEHGGRAAEKTAEALPWISVAAVAVVGVVLLRR